MAESTPERMTRRQILTVVVATTVVWLVFSASWALVPVRVLVTLVHEAGHALAIQLQGGDVAYVIVNEHGGGLTQGRLGSASTTARVIVSSAGYLGTAMVGALLLEGSTHLRRGRIATVVLAGLVAAIGLAWVPLKVDPDPFSAAATGSDTGDGRFTILVCVVAILSLLALAWQPSVRLRATTIVALATAFCLASIDDLRGVLDLSSRGGHSDAAAAAELTGLSSWMWSAIWLVIGVGACVLGLWAALSDDGRREEEVGPFSGPTSTS